MTPVNAVGAPSDLRNLDRYRLQRAGVLNVWQYDDQVFDFADGRLLLRGANGAGKSKTLEMLLPFVLDGDKMRMTASGRHHTSLLWLMSDGYDGQSRIGYLWVELTRPAGDGEAPKVITCGIGIRWSSSAKQASAWHFTSPRRVGIDLLLDDGSGPLNRERCRAEVEKDGHFFEQARPYKQHVGQLLFGLEPGRYDELLRLLYWLRQPQVGEDIDPSRLAEQLANALPELDQTALRAAGDTFDELALFGTQIERRERAATAVATLADVYGSYARGVARERGVGLVAAMSELRRRDADIVRLQHVLDDVEHSLAVAQTQLTAADATIADTASRRRSLEASPEFRSQARLLELDRLAKDALRRAELAAKDQEMASGRVSRARADLARETANLIHELGRLGARGHSDAARLNGLGVSGGLAVPAALFEPALQDHGDVEVLDAAVVAVVEAAAAAEPAVGAAQAVVAVVEEARVASTIADRLRSDEERRAAEAESRADDERRRLGEARAAAAKAAETLRAGLVAWRADPRAVALELPEDLTVDVIRTIRAVAREAAQPRLDELTTALTDAGAMRTTAETTLRNLRLQREQIAAERDPAPPAPALGRSDRDDADGLPLWRLVDPADHLSAAEQAGLEAALESAGLLDAWVRRDGAVLDAERRDVVLSVGAPVAGPTLGQVLRPSVADGAVVADAVVREVLDRIRLVDADAWEDAAAGDVAAPTDPSSSGGAAVALDGSWRLGPLAGRAHKPVAQYLGATARAAERLRRLSVIDSDIATNVETSTAAAAAEALAKGSLRELEAWLLANPPHHELERAWATLDEREGSFERAERASGLARDAAAAARTAAAARHRELDELAMRHRLPTDEHALTARRLALQDIRTALAAYPGHAAVARPLLVRWRRDAELTTELELDAAARATRAGEQRDEAADLVAQHAELLASVGADIVTLGKRLTAVRIEADAAARLRRETDQVIKDLGERRGAARSDVATATDRQHEQLPVVALAAVSLSEIADVPGLLDSIEQRLQVAPTDGATDAGDAADGLSWLDTAMASLHAAGAVVSGDAIPRVVGALARTLATTGEDATGAADSNAVFAALMEVQSGPGADLEPRAVPVGELVAVLGRDHTGEQPVGELARRLAQQVTEDRALLTERERRVFEEHLLGGLGDALRARRQEATELVAAMNALLGGVSTSQGIRVRLAWKLRDDVASDARQAIRLLAQPTGALLPDERTGLRDALHRLVEQSRLQAPDESYTEHLTRALDYRQWFEFRITYSRPEVKGWADLTRRSALSQGEQKVVCYLPLFAAAAAHFSSLAGAAPYAPRFVLLDDAFPKIDVRTHPLLFGLLVDLDLDFVITSERLWGDHATVPSLAIYEALRDPHERGIAQYRHVWDGRRLTAIGA